MLYYLESCNLYLKRARARDLSTDLNRNRNISAF